MDMNGTRDQGVNRWGLWIWSSVIGPNHPMILGLPPTSLPPTSVYLWANSFTSLVPVSSVLGIAVLGEFCSFVGNKLLHPLII